MKTKVINYISNGKTDETISILLEATKNQADLHQAVIVQNPQFKKYQQAKRIEILSFEDENLFINRIHIALLSIVDELEKRKTPKLVTNRKVQLIPILTTFIKKYWSIGIGVLVGHV